MLALVVALLYAPTLHELASLWLRVPYYSYGFLVPLFSAYLLWESRARWWPGRPAWSGQGLALLAAGLGLLAAGLALDSLTLAVLSVPCSLGGIALLGLGRERAKAVAFPVLFLALMAPLPAAALAAMSLPLQRLAAWFTERALLVLGVPAVREGLFVHLRTITLDIDEGCSGLRFLLAMVVVGVAFAWLGPAAPGRRAAIVILAVAVGLAANLVRVLGTALLAEHYGREAATGFFHLAYGKVVYAVMLVPFIAGVLLLWRRERHAAQTCSARSVR